MTAFLTDFEIDEEKMNAFRPMADPCGVGSLEDHWPNNLLSTQTVIYEDGKFGFYKQPVSHSVEPDELELCRLLGAEAAVAASAVELYSETDCALESFFIATNHDTEKPNEISSSLIAELFNGTIFPGTQIWCDPFEAHQSWFQQWDEEGADDDYGEHLAQWRKLMAWFAEHPQLGQPTFVRIGDDTSMYALEQSQFPPGTKMTGSCFPRLVVALTPKGSLVGLVGYEVLT